VILHSSSLYARHKCLSAHSNKLYQNGMLQEEDSSFFGSCVHCEEVLCDDMVDAISQNENRFCTKTDCFFSQKFLLIMT